MTRRATVRTVHDDPAAVAAAVAPDNTDEMETEVESREERRPSSDRTQSDDGAVVTRIERETTGGLHSTVDDYVTNLDVATRIAQHANQRADTTDEPSDTTNEFNDE